MLSASSTQRAFSKECWTQIGYFKRSSMITWKENCLKNSPKISTQITNLLFTFSSLGIWVQQKFVKSWTESCGQWLFSHLSRSFVVQTVIPRSFFLSLFLNFSFFVSLPFLILPLSPFCISKLADEQTLRQSCRHETKASFWNKI